MGDEHDGATVVALFQIGQQSAQSCGNIVGALAILEMVSRIERVLFPDRNVRILELVLERTKVALAQASIGDGRGQMIQVAEKARGLQRASKVGADGHARSIE